MVISLLLKFKIGFRLDKNKVCYWVMSEEIGKGQMQSDS